MINVENINNSTITVNNANGFWSKSAGRFVLWDDEDSMAMMMADSRRQHAEEMKAKTEAEAKTEADKTAQIEQLINRLDKLTMLVEQLLEQQR